MRSRRLTWCLLIGLLYGGALHAQSNKGAPDLAKAEKLFKEAKKAYAQESYDVALSGFLEAYQLSQEPSLLFNIAQCHRELKQYQAALDAYQKFLPNAPDEQSQRAAEAQIKEIEALLPKPLPTPKNPEVKKLDPSMFIPIAAAGVGTGLGIGALIFKAQINGLQGQEVNADLLRQRFLFALGSDLAFIGAGVSYWLLRDKPKKLSLAPTPGGAALVFSYSPEAP